MTIAYEDQLLIQCSRSQMDDEAVAAAARLLREQLDWTYVVETSIRHGVSPLFYWGLKQVMRAVDVGRGVPPPILAELERLYRNNLVRNRRLYQVISDVARAFERAHVAALGLKDTQLAWEVYPDLGLRPMGDIDILIQRQDYAAASSCLQQLGFAALPGGDRPFTLKYASGHHFRRAHDNVWIDLQWNVAQREWDRYGEGNFDFEIGRLWQGAVGMLINDQRLQVPNPEDMLFHLCLHLEGHCYAELVLFCDIVELLRHYENRLNWDKVVALASKYKAESSLYFVLLWVQQLFKVPLPPGLLPSLKPAYFNANLFGCLYDSLTNLHVGLDEIWLAVSPADDAMQQFESAVRQQVVRAMRLYREIDDLATTFAKLGGTLLVLQGTPSEKMFPDPSLRSFGDIRGFILAQDVPRLRQALSQCAFSAAATVRIDSYFKRCPVVTVDPVLAGPPTLLSLESKIETDGLPLHHRADNGCVSKKSAALKALRARLSRRADDESTSVPVRITFLALPPEELVLHLSAQLGVQTHERLFGLCSLVDFFQHYDGPLDWNHIAHLAQQRGLARQAQEGLQLVSDFPCARQTLVGNSEFVNGSDCQPRLLEWARYDPSAWGRYSAFKKMFFYAFSLLSTRGIRRKTGYLVRSLLPMRGKPPLLPSLVLESVVNLLRFARKTERTARTFAYWTEPEGGGAK